MSNPIAYINMFLRLNHINVIWYTFGFAVIILMLKRINKEIKYYVYILQITVGVDKKYIH